jgi:hypothetical protein
MPSVMENVQIQLLAILRALNTTTLAGVTVDDAKVVSSKAYLDAVVIGDDGDPESDAMPVFTQEWANMAHTRRSETGDIPCAAIATTGSTNPDAVRLRAFAILAAVESSLLGDTTLGGTVFTCELIGGAAKQIENSAGAAIVVPFSVRYWAHV